MKELRLAVALTGNIHTDPGTQVKLGFLLKALSRQFHIVQVVDANLSGLPRLLNALRVIHPNRRIWQERFYKNLPAFDARSRKAGRALSMLKGQVDGVLQIGVLFDAQRPPTGLPSVIYTDYTAQLSAARPAAGRSPLPPQQRAAWIARERQAYASAAHVFTRADFVRQSILQDYQIPAEKASVVGGGLNLPELPELPVRDPQRPPVILFIGKEFHRKGGDVLLQAFSQLQSRFPSARLRLLTQKPPQAADTPPQVEWVAPTWDRTAVARLYAEADVFVLPSRLETWGDVLLEAMAYGLPCVGVSGEAMPEMIQDGHTGRIVPPQDAAALALALEELLSSPAQRQSMGLAGRQRVETHFTWDHVVQRMAPVILSVFPSPLYFAKGGAPSKA